MQTFNATLTVLETVSDADDGPYWVTLLNPDMTVANTGRSFGTRAEARAFADGLDMAARMFNARVLFDETVRLEAKIVAGRAHLHLVSSGASS